MAAHEAAIAVLIDGLRPPQSPLPEHVALSFNELLEPYIQTNSQVPSLLVNLLDKCWEVDPNARPTMRTISKTLRHILEILKTIGEEHISTIID